MERILIKTADGSDSLYVKDLDEHYHSIHGALQESLHVYIDAGLKHISSQSKNIDVLEIGFGTGLNALLTCIEAEKLNLNINYSSLEAYPLERDLINKLNYVECLKDEKQQAVFNLIHTCEWEKEITLSHHFILHKIKNTLKEIVFHDTFNLIYFDAFGPRVQPEMWTEEIFTKLFSALKPDGCLVTYCAKGEVKRTLKKAGFILESLPGPPGKREMVRANKK
jgi:tRNA U34 5-methylaminomethyl-2-thiouridine-forming methyltransferase MnmC